jgi:hypothetical protein
MEEEFQTIQSTTERVFAMEFTTKNLTLEIVLIHAPQFQSNITVIRQLDFARLHVQLDTLLSTIIIVANSTAQRLHPSLDFCFLGTTPTGNVSQNALIHNLMHIHFRQTVTVTPPALQEHMPLMPKTKDASQLVLITRLTNFTLILTDVLQLVPLDFGLILLPFHAWQIAPLPLILSKITQPALESACQCALLPTSLGKLSTTHVWNLVQTELTVKFTMRQILL